ncbi:hypothetical protein BBJ28_00020485 [Nothophytophthora sp. Chile5]|nr:hypothetical protein BBJ28_00020485 [Nothophytophthora sp. Chile5]
MRPMFEVENGLDTALRAECRSLDADLGRLSKLSNNSKHAITLNQVQRVQLCTAYDRKDEGGATVYVLDVYLQYVQRGLPTTPGETRSERKVRLRLEKDEGEPEYQVEHRYSAFRTLRKRISEVVVDRKHLRWCAYCSRVTWIVSISSFPSRLPNRGFLAACTGWRRLLVHSRKRKLERFLNDLLSAAKDLSYRNGGGQCRRFLTVSEILNAFLVDSDLRPSGMEDDGVLKLLDAFPSTEGVDELRLVLQGRGAKELRAACTKLRLGPQKKASTNNKEGYIELLCCYLETREGRVPVTSAVQAPVRVEASPVIRPELRTKHCSFRLLNVIFSDWFIERQAVPDAIAVNGALDAGAVTEESAYWRDVARATDGLTFLSFFGGRLDVLYLHDWLQVRPGQLAAVEEGKVPNRARRTTQDSETEDAAVSGATFDEEDTPSKRRRLNPTERLVTLLEEKRAQERQAHHASFEGVTQASRAVQEAIGALSALQGHGFDAAVLRKAELQVDKLVHRWVAQLEKTAAAEESD